ncbi:hypothetical protein J6590_023590 [Homalodisca vitripennis]|nr:hypothetical protein J6590_023590 [Homalodisca vitripennis]
MCADRDKSISAVDLACDNYLISISPHPALAQLPPRRGDGRKSNWEIGGVKNPVARARQEESQAAPWEDRIINERSPRSLHYTAVLSSWQRTGTPTFYRPSHISTRIRNVATVRKTLCLPVERDCLNDKKWGYHDTSVTHNTSEGEVDRGVIWSHNGP